MIFYNWPRICKLSNGRASVIVHILRAILRKKYVNKKPPRGDISRMFYEKIPEEGDSFLINPKTLIRHAHLYSDKEIAEYMGLASFRSYGDYKIFKKKTLDLDISPIKPENILTNKLLRIEGDQVHFIYEDYTKE